jgi:hypothetical protein
MVGSRDDFSRSRDGPQAQPSAWDLWLCRHHCTRVLAEIVGDGVELDAEIGRDQLHRTDDHNSDKACKKTVFDGCCAGLI